MKALEDLQLAIQLSTAGLVIMFLTALLWLLTR